MTRHLGNFSAVEPVYSRLMYCPDCDVDWVGCWDNFMCPECGKGELPSNSLTLPAALSFLSSREKAEFDA